MVRRKLVMFTSVVPLIGVAIVGETFFAAVCAAQGIVFVSDRTGNKEIWRMAPDGSGVFQLTFNPGLDAEPVPSPDGGWIAFVSDAGNPPTAPGERPNTDIWIMRPDGSDPRRLTFYDTAYTHQPAWSPDGGKIAFVHDLPVRGLGEILVDLSEPPYDLATGVSRYNPEYRPTGTHLLYDRDDVGAGWWSQWHMELEEGLPERQLTFSHHGLGGGYRDDGNKIAYIRGLRSVSQVRVMNWDGSGDVLLWDNSAIAYDGWGQATWSPDDRKVAVSVYPSLYPGVPEFNSFVQVLDASTGTQIYRTSEGRNTFALESSWYGDRHFVAGNDVWTSNGSKLVFMSDRDGNWEVYTMNTDGSQQVNLTNTGAWDGDPAWITRMDCNNNGIPDDEDIAACDGSPWCSDCNGSGVPDGCDIADCGGSPWCGDCNGNEVPDGCDIADGTSSDNNDNGIPDECEPICVDDAQCDDGLFCNGAETCVNGLCEPGADPCPGYACDESTDTCDTCAENLVIQGATLSPGRCSHACAEDAATHKIYCFGGAETTSTAINQIVAYDPVTDTLAVQSAALPSARWALGCAQDSATSKFYCFGGTHCCYTFLDEIVEYDPATDTANLRPGTLPSPREAIACAENSATHKIYCFGGSVYPCCNTRTDEVVQYDPVTDTTAPAGTLPAPMAAMSCVENSATHKIYCFGGITGVSASDAIVEYDPGAGTAMPMQSTTPTPRWSLSCAENPGTHKIYCFGGRDNLSFMDEVFEYDPATDTVTVRDIALPTPRVALSCAEDSSTNSIYCFGGWDSEVPWQPALDQILQYQPTGECPLACGTLLVQVNEHRAGDGGSTIIGIEGLELCVFDKSPGSCVRDFGVSHHHYDEIFNNCDPIACAITDVDGATRITLEAGDYVIIGEYDPDGYPPDYDGDERYVGVSASDFQCAPDNDPDTVTMRKHIQVIILPNGRTVGVDPRGSRGGRSTTNELIEITNVGGPDDSVSVITTNDDPYPTRSGYTAVGSGVVIDSSLSAGELFMTVLVAFDADDLRGADPLSVSLAYNNGNTGNWRLAVAGNTQPSPGYEPYAIGDRLAVTSDTVPALSDELGDYGVFWNPTAGQGFVWANVDYASEFATGYIAANDPIPTVSQWGITVMVLALLAVGKILFNQRRAACNLPG